MSRGWRTAALLAMVVMSAACASSTPPAPAQILIAGEFPIDRDGGAGATNASRAVAIALARHPIVDGYRLAYDLLDDSLADFQSRDKALQNAKIVVRDSRIQAVIGPWNSLTTRAFVPVIGPANVAVLSPSNTLDCLTARPTPCWAGGGVANNYFRIAAPDTVGARAEADVAVRKLGLSKFAVITDGVPFYGEAIGDAFAAELIADGAQVVLRRTYSATDQSYVPVLRDAFHAGAQAVFVGGFDDDGACKIRAAMAGVFPADAYFFAGDAIVTAPCLTDAGATADDHLVGAVSARQPPHVPPALAALPHSQVNDAYVFAAYDCAEILVAALDHAIKQNGGKLPTREQVLAEVAATNGYVGLTGTYTFQANGDATSPAVSLYYVRNGSWTFWQNA